MDFILCPTDKYMFKINNKKIWLIYWMCSKLKVNTAWHCLGGFIADLDHSQHINIISCVSTFNFKEAFVSSVRKTSHNVLKNQKSRYLYRNKRCKAYFIERFIITPNWNKLWIYGNTSALNLLCESQVYYRVALWFDMLIIAISRKFFCFMKPKTYLYHWSNSLDYNDVL